MSRTGATLAPSGYLFSDETYPHPARRETRNTQKLIKLMKMSLHRKMETLTLLMFKIKAIEFKR